MVAVLASVVRAAMTSVVLLLLFLLLLPLSCYNDLAATGAVVMMASSSFISQALIRTATCCGDSVIHRIQCTNQMPVKSLKTRFGISTVEWMKH